MAQVSTDPAAADNGRRAQKSGSIESADGPLLMLVSLNQQRMFVYDNNGYVTQTGVSSGRPGHETPKGIYGILEKKVDHTSNIYLDARMPHMQRLTMTGIALHGGIVPGYAASGGCVRLPFDFARRLFGKTELDQRVVIAPDVNAPTAIQHPLLFSALPSAAALDVPGDAAGSTSTSTNAIRAGADAAESLIEVSSAHVATEQPVRTLESAAEARLAKRHNLAAAVAESGNRRDAAADAKKAALEAVSDAKSAARAAKKEAYSTNRDARKAAAALRSRERELEKATSRMPADLANVRADKLQELRADLADQQARFEQADADGDRHAKAAQSAAGAETAADKALEEALQSVKAANVEIKDAAAAEISAKKAVASFEREEANRALPVSIFVSSATGLVKVRQGYEEVLQAQATIENASVPLDTFMFQATGWKDDSKTDLVWQATEVEEETSGLSDYDDERGLQKASSQSAQLPPVTDVVKAQHTLDRIKLPKEVSERIAEVMKPGSTLIVSSFDVSHSEMKYPGTDFIVQMPEVVAKITRPTARPRPVEMVEEDDGWFLFGPPPSYNKPKYRERERRDRRRQRVGGSKSLFW